MGLIDLKILEINYYFSLCFQIVIECSKFNRVIKYVGGHI